MEYEKLEDLESIFRKHQNLKNGLEKLGIWLEIHLVKRRQVSSSKFTEKREASNDEMISPLKRGLWILQLGYDITDLSESGFIKAVRGEIRFQMAEERMTELKKQ